MRYDALLCIALAVLGQGCASGHRGTPDSRSFRSPSTTSDNISVSLRRVYTIHEAKVPEANMVAFSGLADVSIHRPSPEHFKLEEVDGGNTRVGLVFPYLAPPAGKTDRQLGGEIYAYNFAWRGVRFFIGTDRGYQMFMQEDRVVNLYCEAKLKADRRYRLTWACWPIGSEQAVERSVEFVWNPKGSPQEEPALK